MTSALIPPVIPRPPRPATGRAAGPAQPGPCPCPPRPGRRPPWPADVVYGLGRIDASGRVADRTVTCALGWRDGDRLTLTASAGVVTARRDPHGLAILPPRHCIVIPATLRYRCGLLPGDPVLLAPGRPRTR